MIQLTAKQTHYCHDIPILHIIEDARQINTSFQLIIEELRSTVTTDCP